MTITLNGAEYRLVFAHHVRGALPGTQATQVRLEKVGTDFMVDAYALCSAEDQYSKPVGRKVALTRLLAKLPRPSRTEVWRQYWSNVGKGYYNDPRTA